MVGKLLLWLRGFQLATNRWLSLLTSQDHKYPHQSCAILCLSLLESQQYDTAMIFVRRSWCQLSLIRTIVCNGDFPHHTSTLSCSIMQAREIIGPRCTQIKEMEAISHLNMISKSLFIWVIPSLGEAGPAVSCHWRQTYYLVSTTNHPCSSPYSLHQFSSIDGKFNFDSYCIILSTEFEDGNTTGRHTDSLY